MIESLKNVQAGTPNVGSEARSQAIQGVLQSSAKAVNEKIGNAAEKVNSAKRTPDFDEVEIAVETLNENLKRLDVSRQFSIDKQLDKVVVKLIDKEQGHVVKQFPSEEALKLARNIDEMMGLILDERF